MGHYCCSDIVPFVAHDIYAKSNGMYDAEEEDIKSYAPEEYLTGEWHDENGKSDQFDPSEPIVVAGWTFVPFQTAQSQGKHAPCKKGHLYGDLWVKDDMEVWIINEDQYSNVGEYDMCAFSASRDALERYLTDRGLDKPIEETDIVHEWG